jgi:beta-glucan synthesis-associated protein KRE6
MLQSWNKFCFMCGYIEVSMVLPGNDDSFRYGSTFDFLLWLDWWPDCRSGGLVCGLWVILGSPGMAHQQMVHGLIRTSHKWNCSVVIILIFSFCRYNLCDVGTFPNQSLKAGSGPSAAIHSDTSRTKYNFRLSYLLGQHCS